ncbi:MAG: hypothetical protein H6811_04760 [Phycisphaeraceae bacterium]|nr:hypothetical protein [Phycisphaeraceae bacterium]
MAAVLLLVAGSVFAWYFGLFGGSKPGRELDSAAAKEMEEQFDSQRQENERIRKEQERKGVKIEEG